MRKEIKINEQTTIELYTENRDGDALAVMDNYVTIYQLGEEVTLTATQLSMVMKAMKEYVFNKE